jgi:hypothetical protein
MNMGLGMNSSMGFGNQYGANSGSGTSNSTTSNGIIPGISGFENPF